MNGILPPTGHTPSLPDVVVSGAVLGPWPRCLPRWDPGRGMGAAAATPLALPERVQAELG